MADKSNLIAQLGGSGTGYFPDNTNKDITPQRLRDYLTLLINNSLFVDDNFSNDVDELTNLTTKAWSIQAIKDYVAGTGGVSSGIQVTYVFDTGTTAGAGSTEMRLNNATPASATIIYFNDISNNGDASGIISSLTAASQIIFQDPTDIDTYQVFDVTGVPTDLSGEWSVPVVHASGGATTITDGNDVSVLMGLGSQGFNHVLTQNLDAQSNKIINLGDGTASGDAVNLGQLEAVQALIEILRNGTQTLSVSAGAITWDLSTDSPLAEVELDANVTTFTISNQNDHTTIHLVIKQDATGSRTMVAPTGYTATGGSFNINSNGNSYTLATFVKTTSYQIASTDYDGTGGSGSTIGDYTTWSALLLDQGAQTEGLVYRADDAGGHADITTGYAYFEYLGTSAGDETDYNIIAAEEDRARITAVEAELPNKVDKTTVVININTGTEYTSLPSAIATATSGDTLRLVKSIDTTSTSLGVADINGKNLKIRGGGNIIRLDQNTATEVLNIRGGAEVDITDLEIIRRMSVTPTGYDRRTVRVSEAGSKLTGNFRITTEDFASGLAVFSGAEVNARIEFDLSAGWTSFTSPMINNQGGTVVINNSLYHKRGVGRYAIGQVGGTTIINGDIWQDAAAHRVGIITGDGAQIIINGNVRLIGAATGVFDTGNAGTEPGDVHTIKVTGRIYADSDVIPLTRHSVSDGQIDNVTLFNENSYHGPDGTAVVTYVSPLGGGGVEEAPEDGTPYARQDAGWVSVVGGENTELEELEDVYAPVPPNDGEQLVWNQVDGRHEFHDVSGVPVDHGRTNIYLNNTVSVHIPNGSFYSPFNAMVDAITDIDDNYQDTPVTLWIKGDYELANVALPDLYGNFDIIIKEYPGAEVNIYGWEGLTGWTDEGSNIWQITGQTQSNTFMLLLGDTLAPISREGTLYEYTSFGETTPDVLHYIQSDDLNGVGSDDDHIGRKIEGKSRGWDPFRIEEITDSTASNGRLSYDATRLVDNISPDSALDYTFELLNDEAWITSADDWAHNRVANRIQIYSTTNPDSKNVRAVSRDAFLRLGDPATVSDDIKIKVSSGVSFHGFGVAPFIMHGVIHDCNFDGVNFRHCGTAGILAYGSFTEENNHSNVFTNLDMQFMGASGVLFDRAYNTIISYSEFTCYDTDEHVGFWYSIKNILGSCGDGFKFINFTGNAAASNRAYNNTVHRSMVNGMAFTGERVSIIGDYVANSGRISSDIAAVYLSGIWSKNILCKFLKLRDGLHSSKFTSGTTEQSYGLYSDYENSKALLHFNSIINFNACIHLSAGNNNTAVEDNLLAGADHLLKIYHSFGSINVSDNLKVRRNKFLILKAEQKAVYYNAYFDLGTDPITPGAFDENMYVILNGGANFQLRVLGYNLASLDDGISAEMWRMITEAELGVEFDKNSIFKYFHVPEYDGLTSTTLIADTFGSSDRVLSTSEPVTGYPGSGSAHQFAVGFTSATIPDGEAIELTMSIVGSVAGMVLDFAFYGPGSSDLVKRTMWRAGDTDTQFKVYWVNNTGASFTMNQAIFKVKGFDGNAQTITVRHTDFEVNIGTPGPELAVSFLEPNDFLDAVEVEEFETAGPNKKYAVTTPDQYAIVTNNDPRVVIDKDNLYTDLLSPEV